MGDQTHNPKPNGHLHHDNPPSRVVRSESLGVSIAMMAARPRAIILLAGGVRRTDLSAGLKRPLLDLPLPDQRSLLAVWRDHAADLAKVLHAEHMLVRAIVSRPLSLPRTVEQHPRVHIGAEYDAQTFRGTGGLLRDIAQDYHDDDRMLVMTANQILLRPLPELFELLAHAGGDIAMLTDPDDEDCGIALMRAGALRSIRANGYIDFKEQALSTLLTQFDVRVARSPRNAVLPVRTLEQYIRTLRALSDGKDEHDRPDPYEEEWTPTFSVVDPRATVEQGGLVHDSVVMRHAQVGAGAVLVRSVVCEYAKVPAGSMVFDTVVPSERATEDSTKTAQSSRRPTRKSSKARAVPEEID
jgi:hypothetical protein